MKPSAPAAANKGGRPRKLSVLSPEDVAQATSLSRRQIQNLVADGEFPPPIRLSERRVGWFEHEVDDWLSARPRSSFSKPKPEAAAEQVPA